MINFFTVSSILSFLACLLIGALYAWLLYLNTKGLRKDLRYGLFFLRASAITLICWLLFAPLFKKLSYVLEKPILVLAHDNSLSVSQIKPPGFNTAAYQQDMLELTKQLSEKYEVRTYSFGDSVKPGLDFSGNGKLSNASALFQRLNDELLNRNIGAVIMASDGIFNQGGNPLYDLQQLKAPVYTIAMGDTTAKRDVLIANVNYNDLVYLDNEFTLDIEVQAYQSKGEDAQLYVRSNGLQIKDEKINIEGNDFVKNVQLKLKANKVGIQRYDISVSPLKEEITTKNNQQTIFIEVIDTRKKILIVADAPHPDIGMLKQIISLSPHYEVKVVLQDNLTQINPSEYSLAILYQIPGAQQASFKLISRLTDAKIALWYIIGAQTQVNAFNQVQKMVRLNSTGTSLQEILPNLNPNFTLFNIESGLWKQMQNYNPLQAPFGILNINGPYSAILDQKIGKINTQRPLLFFINNEDRKFAFLIGEGIWKWKLEEAKQVESASLVEELVNKTIQYLVVKDDKRKFKAYPAKNTFDDHEQIILNANLYNDAYEPINDPEVSVKIKSANGKEFDYLFSKSGTAYRLDAGSLPEGNYTFLASTQVGDHKYSASGAFYVNALIAEYQQTRANHQLLYTMSQQSGGKMYSPANLLQVSNDLERNDQVKTITYEDRKYEELINFKWIFICIMLLLSMEWFLRKRNGEI